MENCLTWPLIYVFLNLSQKKQNNRLKRSKHLFDNNMLKSYKNKSLWKWVNTRRCEQIAPHISQVNEWKTWQLRKIPKVREISITRGTICLNIRNANFQQCAKWNFPEKSSAWWVCANLIVAKQIEGFETPKRECEGVSRVGELRGQLTSGALAGTSLAKKNARVTKQMGSLCFRNMETTTSPNYKCTTRNTSKRDTHPANKTTCSLIIWVSVMTG